MPDAGSGTSAKDLFTNTSDPMEVFRRATSLYQESRFNEAAAAFLQASRMKEDFVDAHYFAGKSLLKSFPTDNEGMEREFRRVLELVPDHVDARIALAQAFHHSGRDQEAAQLLAEALRLSPGHRGILYSSGMVASRLGRYTESIELLRKALVADPRHVPSLLELAVAQSHLDRDGEALDSFTRVIELQPGNAQALMGAATSLKRLGRESESREMFRRFQLSQSRQEGREMQGKRVETWIRQVQEAYASGNLDQAHASAARLLEDFPSDIKGLLDLGALQVRSGDIEAAIRTHEAVLEVQPDNPSALNRLSGLYERTDDPARAREMRARYQRVSGGGGGF